MERLTIDELIAHCNRQLAKIPSGNVFYQEHESVRAYLQILRHYIALGTVGELATNMETFLAYRHVCGGLPPEKVEALVKADRDRREGCEVETWAACFRCANRKSPTCQKCTRNSFAPCGANKTDEYVCGRDLRGERGSTT